jgi:large subunit ribosomal protein L10
MPKTKQQKQATIESLVEGLKKAKAAVFANFQGLKVSEAEELRRECRKNNVSFLAAKKTLVKKAGEQAGFPGIDPKGYAGGVATFLAFGDEVSAARVVANFAKTHEVVAIYGGILEGKVVDAAVIKSLASLPGKDELLARLVGSINAPVSGFVNVLAANLRNLVGVLNNIREAKA